MTAETDTKAKAKTAAKPKPKIHPIAKVEEGGSVFIDCRKAPDQMKNTILQVLQETLGYHEARKFDYVYSVGALASYRDQIVSEFADYGEDINVASNKYRPFVLILDTFVKEIKEQLADKVEKGAIEFYDIPHFLEKGMEVTTTKDGEELGGLIEGVKLIRSFFGTYYEVQIKVVTNAYGSISDSVYETQIGYFTGLAKIKGLAVSPVTDEEKARLAERGEVFRKYSKGAHYIHYKGQLTRSSYYGSRRFRADGRAMIDVSSFQQVDNNQFSTESRMSGIEHNREDRGTKVDIEIPNGDLWRCFPYLYGFSLSAKQWGRFAVSGLSDIQFREDAFEKLVLPEEDKELVKAIVQDDSADFSDLIDGKGGGSIFLLHGPPGQGKTLTAEAIAEELKRPLYSISVGELGTDPDSLEGTLREILDVATVWNAVLLLDEADIFLEERDEKDIVRNAMVGVFLRLLEYHQGVLFLTTNRVKNIDQAFYSRISIGLKFSEATVSKRKAIWTNLTAAAGVTGLDLDKLAEHDLNGRQIKNVIKLSIKLARAKGEEVGNAMVDSVIARTGQFAKDGERDASDHGQR